jgi:hypothetical protein
MDIQISKIVRTRVDSTGYIYVLCQQILLMITVTITVHI